MIFSDSRYARSEAESIIVHRKERDWGKFNKSLQFYNLLNFAILAQRRANIEIDINIILFSSLVSCQLFERKKYWEKNEVNLNLEVILLKKIVENV